MLRVFSLLLLLGACSTVSADLKQDIAASAPEAGVSDAIAQGLIDASWNLDQAVLVGALSTDDAAPKCLHRVLADLGLDQPAGAPLPSFTPRVNGPISGATVLYIRARQIEHAAGAHHEVSLECKALIGQVMIDAAALARRAAGGIPGIGVIGRIVP